MVNGGFCCEIAVTVPGLLSIILIQISCSLIFAKLVCLTETWKSLRISPLISHRDDSWSDAVLTAMCFSSSVFKAYLKAVHLLQEDKSIILCFPLLIFLFSSESCWLFEFGVSLTISLRGSGFETTKILGSLFFVS